MKRGRRIAFDYGDSRIGVAVCDPDGILATPLPYLDARHPQLRNQIQLLLDAYLPIALFIGLPIHLSGEEGDAVRRAKDFGDVIASLTSTPIVFIDERLSTVNAARRLKESGKSSKEARLLVDSMAAVSILESGLSRENQ